MTTDIVPLLREWEETMWEAIQRLDMGEMDNGIMTSIRFEQHDTLKRAADRIEGLDRQVVDLVRALNTMLVATTDDGKEQFPGHYTAYLETVAKPRARAAIEAAGGVR